MQGERFAPGCEHALRTSEGVGNSFYLDPACRFELVAHVGHRFLRFFVYDDESFVVDLLRLRQGWRPGRAAIGWAGEFFHGRLELDLARAVEHDVSALKLEAGSLRSQQHMIFGCDRYAPGDTRHGDRL